MIRNVLLIILMFTAGFLIYLGVKNLIQPPIWTGVGFIVIAGLFLQKER